MTEFRGDAKIQGYQILDRIAELEDYKEEADALEELQGDIPDDLSDVTLVMESFFDSVWAQDQFRAESGLAGDVDLDGAWPFSLIDWDDAAEIRLEGEDYPSVYFDGDYYRVIPAE